MDNEYLTVKNESLKKDVSNTINFWFGLSIFDNTGFSKQVHKQLNDKESRQYKNLYNALISDVNKFYSMNGIGKTVDGYSEKYEDYFELFNQKLNDFSQITVSKMIGVIETGLQGAFNAKRITDAVQELIAERGNLFEEYLQKNIGQLENYMVLLKGFEDGYGMYLYQSEAKINTCRACNDLNRKTFNIAEAETGVNYPPIHPNCKCRVEVMNYGASFIYSYQKSGAIDNLKGLLDNLPYIDKDVERIGAEKSGEETPNTGYSALEAYRSSQGEPWNKTTPPTEVPIAEEDDEIEPFMNMPLEERTKWPYQGYEENDCFDELENIYSYQQNNFILRTDIKNNDEQRLKEGQYADLTQISAYNGIDNSFIAGESYQGNDSRDGYQRTILFAYDGDRNTDGNIVANGSCSKIDGINKWGYKVYTDTTTGLRIVEVDGKPLICVAIPESYGKVGDIIGIKTDMGYINAIIGDVKGTANYYHSNWSLEDIPNEDGSPVSVIEFIYDNNYWGNVILNNGGRGIKGFASPNVSSIYEPFKCNSILEIANFGSIIPDEGKNDNRFGDNIPLK